MKKYLLLLTGVLLLAGCSGVPLQFPTPLNRIEGTDYQVLGHGVGTATGIMLFNFIPINQNERFQEAYNIAVASRGGTRLLDPVISERWFWAYVLNGYVTTVSGTVVKDLTATPPGAGQAVITPDAKGSAEKIRELKKLLDDGLISKEEYESKKKQLVDEL